MSKVEKNHWLGYRSLPVRTLFACAAFLLLAGAAGQIQADQATGVYQSPAVGASPVPPLNTASSAPPENAWGLSEQEPLAITPGHEVDLSPPVEQDGDELHSVQATFTVMTTLAETPPQFSNPVVIDGIGPNTGASPPDTVGDVGPNHYVHSVNGGGAADTRIQVFNKDGTTATGVLQTNNTLWSDLPGCGTYPLTDPIVLYDELADRWMFGEFARDIPGDNPWALCIAVSQTGDPTGSWNAYEFPLDFVPDYEKFGVWPDGYYMSSQRGFPDGGIDVWVFDRDEMLVGNPATFQMIHRDEKSLIFLPSDLDGPEPPTASPNYFVRQVDGDIYGGSDRIDICEFATDWDTPANTTFTCSNVSVAGFDSNLCGGDEELGETCIPQPDTTQNLDSLTPWPMFRNQYRNFGTDEHETMTFNHTVDVDGAGHAGVRWYELRNSGGTWTVFQQGTFSPDDGDAGLEDDPHRWMGSIAMDRVGNMALGYSVSDDASTYPGIRYSGRFEDDPAGSLPQGEVVVQAGAASQDGERWGDYSAMTVDPSDGCTFWFTTEFITGTGAWDTRIANFRLPSCNQPPICDANGPYVAECAVSMTLDGSGSWDPDDDPLSYSWTGPFTPSPATGAEPSVTFPSPTGLKTVDLTVDDGWDTDACSASVTVEDTIDPTIVAPEDITAECTSPDGTAVGDLGEPTVSDLCDADVDFTNDAPLLFDLGDTTVTWTATDDDLNSAQDTQTVTIEDTTPPVITCNNEPMIVPPDAPISFTATASDVCEGDIVPEIIEFDCYAFTKKGKRIDKTDSCVVTFTGDTITILDSGGVDDNIEWIVTATDSSGNTAEETCSLVVVNPGRNK